MSSTSGRISAAEVDQRSIIQLSQACTEELEMKAREKNALIKMLADLKKKKMQCDAKLAKKKRDVDQAVVNTMDLEKKLNSINNSNRIMAAELAGLRSENERLEGDVEVLRSNYGEANACYEEKAADVEKLRRTLHSYRKEIGVETKHRDNVQQDLRASRTAQNLMIHRLDDMEKRNRALKTCVASTFNT